MTGISRRRFGADPKEAWTPGPPPHSRASTDYPHSTHTAAAMATANLLSPPPSIPPQTALALSQKAPLILASPPTSSLPWPLSLLFSRETPESWAIHENLFLSALRTGDEKAAAQILSRLESRFGEHNERIIVLRGIYNESTARTTSDLEKVFEGYEKILREDPTNMSIRKRRVAVLKSLGRTSDAITAVTVLLQNSPTDVEAWAEASELYASQAAWGQAIYCAEEVLLAAANSWSAHAHVASLHYMSTATNNPPSLSELSLALKHFCRAAELNEGYLRGFYGIKIVAAKLLPLLSDTQASSKKRGEQDDDDVPIPTLASVQKLDEIATKKLGEFIREFGDKKGRSGYDEAEIIAAKELLNR
ncbi:hypothetical protein OPT61_g9084 [Boeremia exigua]|uniref:Uncharacterized protein n=1 Tax=Boeremia exigua TaxID=749465 RepID=A0ACC2HWN9_9PLEO|nr:hypothetical protein OPT61_g9084 [Boeremia exigua]